MTHRQRPRLVTRNRPRNRFQPNRAHWAPFAMNANVWRRNRLGWSRRSRGAQMSRQTRAGPAQQFN
eukprot:6531841-Pyramimonas_sp.AAC.1